MAELLCGAIPGICGTVAAHHRRINGARISAQVEIFLRQPLDQSR
jgi:hypothetical protein